MDDNRVQKSIYYTSKMLHDAETKYSKLEKIISALIIFAQYLRPYFQAYPIVVIIDQQLKAILHWPDILDD